MGRNQMKEIQEEEEGHEKQWGRRNRQTHSEFFYLVVIFVFPSWQEKLLTRRTMSPAAITRAASISIPRLYGLVCITNAVVPTLTVLMRESNMTPFRALPPVEFGPQAQSDHLDIQPRARCNGPNPLPLPDCRSRIKGQRRSQEV